MCILANHGKLLIICQSTFIQVSIIIRRIDCFCRSASKWRRWKLFTPSPNLRCCHPGLPSPWKTIRTRWVQNWNWKSLLLLKFSEYEYIQYGHWTAVKGGHECLQRSIYAKVPICEKSEYEQEKEGGGRTVACVQYVATHKLPISSYSDASY